MQIRLVSQRSVSLTAGSCPLNVMKGQQLPWKDKPGKTQLKASSYSQALQHDLYRNSPHDNTALSWGLWWATPLEAKLSYLMLSLLAQYYLTTPTNSTAYILKNFILWSLPKRFAYFESLILWTSFSEERLPSTLKERHIAASCTLLFCFGPPPPHSHFVLLL